jgi:hypothetical protein
MRNVGLGLVFVLGLVGTFASAAVQSTSQGGNEQAVEKFVRDSTVFAKDSGLIAIKLNGTQAADMVAVIDPLKRTLASYQIDAEGVITLRSVRSIDQDLQLDEYNGTSPTPKQIREFRQK